MHETSAGPLCSSEGVNEGVSMKGKVVVMTGSNVGIGLETAVGVAGLEATTVLACRNEAKATAAAAEVTQRTWNDDVHVVRLDLGDLDSVRAAAEEILRRWERLDVLVNNAGGTWTQRQLTAQGFEQTFGVNHLGHFYLTNLLLERLPRHGSVTDRQPHVGRPSRRVEGHAASTISRARTATRGSRPIAAPNWPTCCSPAKSPAGSRAAGSRPTPPIPARCAAVSAWTAT